jgi:hypothetical protein
MEDNRIIDTAMPHPDQDDEVEKEYIVCGWIPVMVQTTVTATDEQEAIKYARYEMRNGQTPYKVVDKDFNELDVTFVEEA